VFEGPRFSLGAVFGQISATEMTATATKAVPTSQARRRRHRYEERSLFTLRTR
jgi:hypothetical protein